MRNKLYINLFICVMMVACNEMNVKKWSDSEVNNWLQQSKWSTGLSMKPDESINKRLFIEQNLSQPEAWEVAYTFLSESDFQAMPEGKYELSHGVFATITDYTTKDSALFEAHKKYVDIQYVAKGEEYILITPLDGKINIKPYDPVHDIEFFDKESYTTHLADQGCFLVLFPTDGHKPCIKVHSNDSVRKIVMKIPFKE